MVYEDKRHIQLAELKIIKEFSDLCEKNKFRFFMMGGTFLGAVRHKGFIPWDDDADFALPRKDFDEFIKKFKEHNSPYKLESFENSKSYNWYTPKIRDETVKVRIETNKNSRIGTASIDIFVLDGMPNGRLARRLHIKRLNMLRAIYAISDFENIVNIKRKNRPIHERALIEICKIIPLSRLINTKKALNRLDKALRKYSYDESNYVVNYMGSYHLKEMFPRKIYDNVAKYKFESLSLPAPSDYNRVLTQMYGNYMKTPPEHSRNKHESKLIKEK